MKQIFLALTLCLLTGCGGLPLSREMGDMALMRTMAVDTAEQNKLSVTVSTGRQASGLQKEGEAPLILTTEERSMSGACLAMQGESDRYVFYGYVDQLLLGEQLCETGILPVLEYFSRDMELGMGAQVWMVDGEAQSVITAAKEEGIDERLSILRTDSEMGLAGFTRTVGEVLSDILENGGGYLPVLTQNENGIKETGYAIFRGDCLVGVLTGEQAKGLELLESEAPVGVVDGNLEGRSDVLRIQEVHTAFQPEFEDGHLISLTIRCRVTADLTEFSAPLTDAEVDKLTVQLKRTIAGWTAEAMEAMQRLRCDGFALAGEVARIAPQHWAAVRENWTEVFPDLPWEIVVDTDIRRSFGAVMQDERTG